MIRLPQDAFMGERTRGVPDLATLRATVEEYAAARLAAADHEARAMACWGLVARGDESLGWCQANVHSHDPDLAEDAAGVLAWIGCPTVLADKLRSQLDRMPHGAAKELLVILLRRPRDTAKTTWEGVPLRGEGEPFTSILYFVEAPFEGLVAEHERWMREQRRGVSARGIRGSLDQLVASLEPVVMPSWKYLFVETPSTWTAVVSQASDLNWIDGFAGRLRTRVVRTSHAPHVARSGRVVRYGGTSFAITDGRRDDLRPLRRVRAIQASHQGSGWDWVLTGEVQAFEELDAYTSKRVRDRFDLARLNRYCRSLGIRRDAEDFYGPRAMLFEVDTTEWHQLPGPGIPSSEWRAAHR